MQTRTILANLAFPEAPRWYQGRLWFTDQHAGRIIAVEPSGEAEIIATLNDRPGGLGWLPDGQLLVVAMTNRAVLRLGENGLEPYADLSALAPWHCNDMLVDRRGHAYVGNFGYDIDGGASSCPTRLIHIDPAGAATLAGGPLVFPNGMTIVEATDTLLCAETFGHRISAFQRNTDGSLGKQEVWAEFAQPDAPVTPDGICIDADGALWVASPTTAELLRLAPGGKVLDRITPSAPPYACALGGNEGNMLFICTAQSHDPIACAKHRTGRIEVTTVTTPAAPPITC